MMNANPHAPIPTSINARDISMLTAKLAQLLAQEVDYLNAMQISKIAALQEEKRFLTNALEAHRKSIAKNPHLIETIPSQDLSELKGIVGVFEDILRENHRKLNMARAVNTKVVETISQVVRESARSPVYGATGQQGAMNGQSLSVTLNQTV